MRATTTTVSKTGMAILFALATASSASASIDGSVANTSCKSLTVPLFQFTVGNEGYPFNEDATHITSQDVDTVTFSVSQLWMDTGTPMVAVQYRDVSVEEDVDVEWTCNINTPQELIEFESTQEYTAQCVHGYAEVGVYAYVGGLGTVFNINEYEACTATDDNYVGYSVILPCVPVCGPQTPDCFDGPTVSLADIEHESSCLYEETPIMTDIAGLYEDSVEFTIKNTWPTGAVSALSIHYTNTAGEIQCDTFDDMTNFDSSSAIEALCVNGLAEVGIQIYSTGIKFISSIKPEECNAPSGAGIGQCSYEFVVPCTDGEVCTGDSFSPSSSPSSTLSVFPTGEAVDVVPPCVELSKPIINEIAGNNDIYTGVDDFEIAPVSITSQNIDDVTIKVTQVFNSDGIPMMAVGYQGSESNENECEIEAPQGKVDYNFEMEITAQCHMGYAEIALYLYVGYNDFVVEDCEACTLPNEEDYVAFYLVVPCIPVCKPETPDCLDGPMVILADIETESVCLYEDMPIVINEAHEEYMNPNNVEFSIQNTWPSNSDISTISVSYKEKESGLLQCDTFGVNDDATFIQAQCEDGMATVIVEFHSTQINYQANLLSTNSCGTPTVGTCAYEMVIPCDPMLECGWSDSPSAVPTDSPSTSPSSIPSDAPSGTPSEPPSAAPSLSPSYDPTAVEVDLKFCVPSDPILVSNDGDTMYPYSPITITFQNTTHVAFKVENSFGNTVSSVYTEYHKSGLFGETECVEEENVEKNSLVGSQFVAQCTHNSKISMVNLWMTDCGVTTSFLDQTDNAEIPQCCHPGDLCRTVQYTFMLPCISPCPEDAVFPPTSPPINGGEFGRTAEESTGVEGSVQRSLDEKIKNKRYILPVDDANDEAGARRNLHVLAEKIKEDPERNDEEHNFCVNADYPCGTDIDKVYVCHYSARDGYKTFCVPESDSDALRFYPKDYCGPCVGGYSTS